MPRFRFRLQKLLQLRERAEQEAARELSGLLGRRLAAAEHLERLSDLGRPLA